MKISEMTNDQAAAAFIRMSAPIANICDDDEMLKTIGEITTAKREGVAGMRAVIQRLPQILSVGLKKHKIDTQEIIGALLDVPARAVGQMKFMDTVKAVRESFDEDFIDFFTSFATPIQKKGGS